MAKFNVNTSPVAAPAWEKAAGFLNLYLPTKDGGRNKLGAIGLKLSVAEEKRLFEALNKSPDEADRIVKAILSKLIIEFRSAEKAPGTGFDIY